MPGDLERVVEKAGFVKRVVAFADVRRLVSLPPLHRDPFDRMLVAQALEEGLPIVTRDAQIARYGVQCIW